MKGVVHGPKDLRPRASFSPLRTGRPLKALAAHGTGMTHHTPSETLREEHRVIEHLLDAVEGMAARLERGERVPRADVEAALAVIEGFADRCHHAKEEKVLFGALRDLGTPRALLVVQELEDQHRAGRRLAAGMRAAATGADSDDAAAKQRLARDARRYAALSRRHIETESTQLLPIAESLTAIVRDRVAEEFDRVERAEVGVGVHERYERAVHALHETYAPKGSSGASLSRSH